MDQEKVIHAEEMEIDLRELLSITNKSGKLAYFYAWGEKMVLETTVTGAE